MTGHDVMNLHTVATVTYRAHPSCPGQQVIDNRLSKGHANSLAELATRDEDSDADQCEPDTCRWGKVAVSVPVACPIGR